MRFNASVAISAGHLSTPFVVFYDLLNAALNNLILVLLQIVGDWRADNTFDVVGPDEAQLRSRESPFNEGLILSLQFLFCDSAVINLPEPALSFVGERRKILPMLLAAVDGAQSFVWFHEYGHLLKGHLRRRPSPTIEFEADDFAIVVTGNPTQKKGLSSWAFLGVVFLFLALIAIEERNGGGAHESHPPARERLQRLLQRIERSNRVFTRTAMSAAAALNTVLEAKWDFRVEA